MTGDGRPLLAVDEVVARYVGGAHIDPGTRQINGSAFERAPKDVDGVSFTRRGIFATDEVEDRAAIRKVVGSRLKLGRTAVFAELVVGDALDALRDFDPDVIFTADPQPAFGAALANPAHALLVDLPFKGEEIGGLTSEYAGDRLRLRIKDQFSATE